MTKREWLAGGGELAALIAETDWSGTPLGGIDQFSTRRTLERTRLG